MSVKHARFYFGVNLFALGSCRVDKFVLGISAAAALFGTFSQQGRGDLQCAANELGGIVPARFALATLLPSATPAIFIGAGDFHNFRAPRFAL
jgi:hypothetical protein